MLFLINPNKHKMKSFIQNLFPFAIVLLLCNCSNDYTEIPDNETELQKAKATLGEKLFFEKGMSNPTGMACANCHSPETGFSDPLHSITSPGINPALFGSRNSPSLAYTVFAPEQYYNGVDETYIGGLFYDGRAQTLEAQAVQPLLSAHEMNNSSVQMVANKIRNLSYYADFAKLYGASSNDSDLINQFSNAISFFEKSTKMNSFTSKFDYFNKQLIAFSEDEKKGLLLFKGKANCASCHVLEPDEKVGKILFTDFSYDNIGVPKNPNNPFYAMPTSLNPEGANYVDFGIGKIVNQTNHDGKFKVPTLRNVAVSAPYFHNGFYSTLAEVIHFYNKRNVENLGTPEVNQNVNTTELGNLLLSPQEELQLEKFLLTLTDHYQR